MFASQLLILSGVLSGVGNVAQRGLSEMIGRQTAKCRLLKNNNTFMDMRGTAELGDNELQPASCPSTVCDWTKISQTVLVTTD